MFTGIIQAVGHITALKHCGDDRRIEINAGDLPMDDVSIGDSICVSGVCLTVVQSGGNSFSADVSGETLRLTLLGDLSVNDAVNLEKALTLETHLGGHLVSGHVDGVGEVVARHEEGRSVRFSIRAADALARYIAARGSVCVDGVSLTVNAVNGAGFDLNVVPHTLAATTLHAWRCGSRVNLEVDLIARYLERLLLGDAAARPDTGEGLTREILEAHGFGVGNK